MMPSPEHEALVAMIGDGLALESLALEEQRAAMEASAEFFPPDPDVLVDAIDAGGVPAEWISVTGSEPSRTVLYLHGGAYVMGSPKSHRGLAGRIARAAGARVLVVDYRLAPENPFPAALDDALTCWRWLLGNGTSPEQSIIAGDSAGGGLALASLLAMRDADEALPA